MEQFFNPPHKKWLYLFGSLSFLFSILTIILVIMGKHRENALYLAGPFLLTALSMYHTIDCLRQIQVSKYKNELFNLLLEKPRLIHISNSRLELDDEMLEMHGIEYKKYRILSQRDFIEVVTAIKRGQPKD